MHYVLGFVLDKLLNVPIILIIKRHRKRFASASNIPSYFALGIQARNFAHCRYCISSEQCSIDISKFVFLVESGFDGI